MRQALETQDFGHVLATYRAGLPNKPTQTGLSRWLGITQGEVICIERCMARIHDLDKLDRWARTLGIPQRYLWFRLSTTPPDACETDSAFAKRRTTANAEGDDVQRRQFLATTGTSLLTNARDRLLPTTPAPSSGNPDIDTIREITHTFRKLGNRHGGGHIRSTLTTFLTSTVEPKLRDPGNGTTRNELFSAAAELYQLAG